jgi:choline dehydrogenase
VSIRACDFVSFPTFSLTTMRLIPLLLSFPLLCAIASPHSQPHLHKRSEVVQTNPSVANGKTFDFIVVGGGLAGLTVAARLAQNSTLTILVVEAGNDDRGDSRIYDVYK